MFIKQNLGLYSPKKKKKKRGIQQMCSFDFFYWSQVGRVLPWCLSYNIICNVQVINTLPLFLFCTCKI